MVPFRMVSIDPGTTTLGIAVSEFDDDLSRMVVVDAMTIRGDILAKRYNPEYILRHGDRNARLIALRGALKRYFDTWLPTVICSEAAYLGRSAQAYAALIEAVSMIRYACELYDPSIRLETFTPSEVKVGVGVGGRSGDKELMRAALEKVEDLWIQVPLDSLDEHAIDAIAVGYVKFMTNIRGTRHEYPQCRGTAG